MLKPTCEEKCFIFSLPPALFFLKKVPGEFYGISLLLGIAHCFLVAAPKGNPCSLWSGKTNLLIFYLRNRGTIKSNLQWAEGLQLFIEIEAFHEKVPIWTWFSTRNSKWIIWAFLFCFGNGEVSHFDRDRIVISMMQECFTSTFSFYYIFCQL